MTWADVVRALRPPPTLFRSDPQSVEVVCGWVIAALGAWCWIFGWFGGFLPRLAAFSGWEPVVGAVMIIYGVRHALAAHGRNRKGRARRALLMAWVSTFLGLLIGQQIGWDAPAVPVSFVTALAQGWVYLRHTGAIQ